MSTSIFLTFLDLPIEIIVRTFLLLDVYDLHTISHLNKTCHAVYKQHLELDFELKAAGVINGTREVNSQEKLKALARRERNWRSLIPSHIGAVKVAHCPSTIYDLSSGVYILGDASQNNYRRSTVSLRYAELSKFEDSHEDISDDDTGDDEELPQRTPAGSEWGVVEAEGDIVDFGLCIDEHDLVALIELMPGFGERPIKLRLCQFSTGTPHPAATKPTIDLGTKHETWGRMSIMIEVVGPYLVLLLNWNMDEVDPAVGPRDRLMLFNWYSGEMVVEEHSRRDVWNGFIFLTPHIFVLTNNERGCLDAIHILQNLPKSPSQQPRTSFSRLLSFMLPRPVAGFEYYNIASRSDPNSFGVQPDESVSLGTAKSRHRLFANDSDKAIVIFRLMLKYVMRPGHIRFSFVIHRSSLLHHVQEAHSWIASDSRPSQETPNPSVVDWEVWGTDSTRWLSEDAFRTPWITATAGQREVFMREETGTIVVRDYNPVAVRRAIWETRNAVFDSMGGRRRLITESQDLQAWAFVFTSSGKNLLPCVEVETPEGEEFEFDGVLMDENHLLGLNRSFFSHDIVSYEIWTF